MTEPRSPPLVGLREKRIFRRYSQQDAAMVLGITQSHYRQMETGIIRTDLYRAKKLADWLGCTIEELM